MNAANDDAAIDWQRVKLVVFDVDGTLYRQRLLRMRVAGDMLLHVIRHCTAEVPSVIRTYRQLRERMGSAEVVGFEARLIGETSRLTGRSRFRVHSIVQEWIDRRPLPHLAVARYPGVLELFAAIKRAGTTIGIFSDYPAQVVNWGQVLHSLKEDEFCLDPTRLTLVCGTAGFDGTQFKGILANRYGIQVNKTSRNSVLIQSNINNTRSDVAHLIRVLAEISGEIERGLSQGGVKAASVFAERVKSLMTDVPNLPNFSHFHDGFRSDAGNKTNEGDIRSGFYAAYDEAGCEHIRLNDPEIDRRLKNGPDLVSANFVIPYPPGFPIMVPGQVITRETIDFMRKLDVKEIHGYDATEGLKLVRPEALAKLGDGRSRTHGIKAAAE